MEAQMRASLAMLQAMGAAMSSANGNPQSPPPSYTSVVEDVE